MILETLLKRIFGGSTGCIEPLTPPPPPPPLKHKPKPILPPQFKGPFYGFGMGRVFIRTDQGDTTVLDIRGWGYLTGKAALAMNEDEAAKTQDEFEKWVITALNNHSQQ